MDMRTLLATVGLLVFGAGKSNAEETVKVYREDIAAGRQSSDFYMIRAFITGLGEGMIWANAQSTNNKVPLFCAGHLPLHFENYTDILDREIKKLSTVESEEKLAQTPIGLVLLLGLQETFPCDAK